LRARGIALAVLSNGWNPLQIHKARRAGFEGPVLASADLGVQKPDRRAFAALVDLLGTEGDTWYVGDDPRIDVEGARAAGIRAIWLDAEKRAFPSDLPAPSLTIHTLEELTACVPA
jgi:putative hydrolase of the HAD superfamily